METLNQHKWLHNTSSNNILTREIIDIINNDKTLPNESEIQQRYINLPDEQVNILCSYTTRLEGFIDIILSKQLLCSRQVGELLGKVNTHRWESMRTKKMNDRYSQNDYISVSSWFVSYKYSDSKIKSRQDYKWWYWILIPVQKVFEQENLEISHCSNNRWVNNREMDKEKIFNGIHLARKQWELTDDWFWNIFEIMIWTSYEKPDNFLSRMVLQYPKISVTDCIIAIPLNEKENIERLLLEKQKLYIDLLNKIANTSQEDRIWLTIDDRDIINPQKTIEFLQEMTEHTDLSQLPIYWYSHKNLDVALQYLSIHSNT